jgi:hypothetical protein
LSDVTASDCWCRRKGATSVAGRSLPVLVPGDHVAGFGARPTLSEDVEGYAVVGKPVLELLVMREDGSDRSGAVKFDRGVEVDRVEGPHLARKS